METDKMTPTEQTPSERKHFNLWKCMAHGKEHPCVFASELANAFILNCPDYEPKENN